ncbi:MAG: SAM-dependent methyltransferase [Bacteroidota bacterium]
MGNSKGCIYLIPIVIAESTEASVIPPYVKPAIEKIDYYLAENVRTARRYFSKLKIGKPIESIQFEVLDKKTDETNIRALLNPVFNGQDVGIISESGCPGIADPGAMAVDFAHKNDIVIKPLVGPSSILLALIGSGLSGQHFAFHGYLPIDKVSRTKTINELETQSKRKDQTQIFIETPYRNDQLFSALLSECRNATRICVAKDLTGATELIQTKTVAQWRRKPIQIGKVPTVFLLHAS